MNNSYILSVVIPSKNKLIYLSETIQSLIKEPSFDQIELCISDNSGSNETKIYCKELANSFVNVKYMTADTSSNLDENINNAVLMANGKYVWLMGDDDICEINALEKIINKLNDISPAFMIVNSSSFEESNIIEVSRALNIDKFYSIDDNDQFLVELGSYVTFLSAIVVKKNLWVKFFDSNKIGSYFAHLNNILSIKIYNECFYLSNVCVKMRVHSQTWTAKHFEIWKIKFPEIIWGSHKYSDEAKKKVISKNLLNTFGVTLSSRAYDRYNFDIFKKVILKNRSVFIFFKFFHFFVAIFPKKLLTYFYILLIKSGLKKSKNNFSSNLALSFLKKKN